MCRAFLDVDRPITSSSSLPPSPRVRFATLIAVSLSGCLGGCGVNAGSSPAGEVGTYPEGGTFPSGDAANGQPLDAYIEQGTTQVEILTLSCSGPCADVQAVATNGHPPYAFTWEDGTSGAFRHVCPTANTQYEVTVTDTGTTGEIARPAATVKVPLTADVIACPTTNDAGADASPPPGTTCVTYTNADMPEAPCPDPIGGQSAFRIPLPPLTGGAAVYSVTISSDLAGKGGISAQLNSYYSTGSCDRSNPGGTGVSTAGPSGNPEFPQYTECFPGGTKPYTEFLVDFVPGLGGGGYTLTSWSAKVCTAPICPGAP